MRIIHTLVFFMVFIWSVNSQTKIDRTLKLLNNESVPYVHVDELSEIANVILLDSRKREEYEVSHLNNAIWVGHEAFEIDSTLANIKNRDSEIVVYCSIGVRSEDIGEKLMKAGFTNVKNLYGGIFEWKNEGFPVYDTKGKETQKVHAFDKQWGKLLLKGEKVYDQKKARKKKETIQNK